MHNLTPFRLNDPDRERRAAELSEPDVYSSKRTIIGAKHVKSTLELWNFTESE